MQSTTMDLEALSATLQEQAPSDAEQQRIRELSRYYCTFGRPSKSHDPVTRDDGKPPASLPTSREDDSPSVADLSSDMTLNALTQLGLHRLKCNRSFVVLVDGQNQHIIAETTRSISLRDKDKHVSGDQLYLGARSLDIAWAGTKRSLQVFTGHDPPIVIETPNITANRTRSIILDLTQEALTKDLPYVANWPYMRFYAEVPLYSPSGYVLGVYSVIDSEPRAAFGNEEITVLREIADAIAQHLENVRIVHSHRRADRLVKGLTTFVKTQSTWENMEEIAHSNPHISTADMRGVSKQSETTAETDGVDRPSLSTDTTNQAPSSISQSHRPLGPGSASETSHAPGAPAEKGTTSREDTRLDDDIESDNLMATGSGYESPPMVTVTESVTISQRTASIFARASALLRDSMDLEGVLFLDACRNNHGIASTSSGNWEPLPRAANPGRVASCSPHLSNEGLLLDDADRRCDLLGWSMKIPENKHADSAGEVAVTEGLLRHMITVFPQGHVFNLDGQFSAGHEPQAGKRRSSQDSGPTARVSREAAAQEIEAQLARHLPEARSVLFFPLWDWNKSRWLAGTLVWTHDSGRALGAEELHYFKIFGDSIISDVARADWSTAEKSKSDFISSVSHELRSPLHGVLANAELLHTTALAPVQRDMVKMIEVSGLTLLDTMNHLLDFTKINNLTTAKKDAISSATKGTTNLDTVFELDNLVEEVTNIIYTGRKAPTSVSQFTGNTLSGASAAGVASTPTPTWGAGNADDLTVAIRVEELHTWKVRSVAGAWRRIVMNLVGNALKYTQRGFIEISLSKATNVSNSSDSAVAHLSVTDTGRGISPDFLKHKLFSPFAQEDSVSEGVGLGMSIVRQLVSSLGGSIDVKSEVGMGTQVDVYIPMQFLKTSRSSHVPGGSDAYCRTESVGMVPAPQVCLVGFTGHNDLNEAPTASLSAEAKRKLLIQNCVKSAFVTQAGWTVTFAESLERAHGDVAVIEESTLMEGMDQADLQSRLCAFTGFKCFLVLDGKSPPRECTGGDNVFRLSQPFGPRKIGNALSTILSYCESSKRGMPTPWPGPVELLNINQHAENDQWLGELTEVPDGSLPLIETLNMDERLTTEVVGSPVFRPSVSEPDQSDNGHVLIVDDNDVNLKILGAFMRKMGCSYRTASNGLIALETYKTSRRRFDYILMDISMPVMNGLMAARLIRDFESQNATPPSIILAVTGVASTTMQQQALSAGMNDYLIKPISLRELRKIMDIA